MPDYPVDYRKEFTDMYRAARNYQNYRKIQELEKLQDLEALDALEAELELEAELDLQPEEEPERRNRGGAPRGNQNARKHGLYSRILPPESREDAVVELPARSLTPEIDAIRLKLAELMADPQMKLNDLLPTLRVLAQLVSVNQKFDSFGPY